MYTSIARLCLLSMRRSSSSSIATLFFCVSPDRDRKGTRCFFFSKRPASLQVMTFVVLLSKTRFFLCFFHFRPSWNLIVENKKRGGEISTSMDKKKKQKKRHQEMPYFSIWSTRKEYPYPGSNWGSFAC